MPRRGKVEKRVVPPDIKYGSVEVAKLINKVMWDGKKTKAEKIVYKAFDIIKERLNEDPLEVFMTALRNAMPELEVRPRRVGGATYQIPIEVPEERAKSLAIRWLVDSARAKKGRPMAEKLAMEITDAYRNEGATIKKKTDLYKMAIANRAFVHYRW